MESHPSRGFDQRFSRFGDPKNWDPGTVGSWIILELPSGYLTVRHGIDGP